MSVRPADDGAWGGREQRRRERRPFHDAPSTASARAHLRGSLPQPYRVPEDNFAMRFLETLEQALDPIVAQLDMLTSFLDIEVAPPEAVRLMSAWLGVPSDATWPTETQRSLLRNAAELRRRHGTPGGLALLMRLAFPADDLAVSDSGGTTWTRDRANREWDRREAFVTIASPHALSDSKQQTIRRVALRAVPADVAVTVRVEEKRS